MTYIAELRDVDHMDDQVTIAGHVHSLNYSRDPLNIDVKLDHDKWNLNRLVFLYQFDERTLQ